MSPEVKCYSHCGIATCALALNFISAPLIFGDRSIRSAANGLAL
jgi:hypothetical protein